MNQAPDRFRVELRAVPDFWRWRNTELVLIEGQRLAILSIENVDLFIKRKQFRYVIEAMSENVRTEVAIRCVEELMFVPNLIDDH